RIFFQVDAGSDIKQATNAKRGIDQHAAGVARGVSPLPLQHVIERTAYILEVLEHARDRIIEPTGRDLAIAFRDRLEGILVDGFVERINAPVPALPRIRIDGVLLSGM